jgi:hypothetical protein
MRRSISRAGRLVYEDQLYRGEMTQDEKLSFIRQYGRPAFTNLPNKRPYTPPKRSEMDGEQTLAFIKAHGVAAYDELEM